LANNPAAIGQHSPRICRNNMIDFMQYSCYTDFAKYNLTMMYYCAWFFLCKKRRLFFTCFNAVLNYVWRQLKPAFLLRSFGCAFFI